MKSYLKIVLAIGVLLVSQSMNAQTFLRTQGKAVVNEVGDTILLRGMGLGGWMLQEGYMIKTQGFANPQYQIRQNIEDLIGEEDTDEFYDAWLANHVTKKDIDSLAAWGFNSVRLPMHYNLYTLPIQQEPVFGQQTWLEKGFALTDSLINWCRANEMYVILDLHAAPGGQGMDEGISDYNPNLPSLWESQQNRDKTVALWRRLAERYKDEPVVGAYDLLNETNWNMDNNQPLKDLYLDITEAIRQVDNNHILIIEGNWFANDFTNLTPPWDDNLMYGPHKYWSTNDKASIQWVIDIREAYDVPIYFGESGENGNPWFRDAIKLIEDEGMGWAWWPMKKIDDIAGPLSINRTAEYDVLLDYWENGGAKPSAAFAKATLMQLTEDLKIENCFYQKDVIDAMFRQVQSDEAIPYNRHSIPGVVHASDFDMGINGSAYNDVDLANFHVSTGNFTAWNRGWSYRNDGVDLERNSDAVNSNGFHVGFIADGEWIQYTVDVEASALYDVRARIATQADGGKFHLASGTADITSVIDVPNTGGWTTFQTITIPDVLLTPEDNQLRFYVDDVEFNLLSFEFIQKQASTSVAMEYLTGDTPDESTVQLFLNKPLDGTTAPLASNFTITVDGDAVVINSIEIDPDNPRIIKITIAGEIRSQQDVRASYNGNNLNASDGTTLQTFTNRVVRNTVAIVSTIPGKLEMEDYFFQQGIQTESTTDVGGGRNIGFLDQGDFLDYWIDVAVQGTYNVDFRTAAQSEEGGIRMQLIDAQGNANDVTSATFPSTGGWQTWTTTSKEIFLPSGRHQLRVNITQSLFNMNWMDFSLISSVVEPLNIKEFKLFPNPTSDILSISGSFDKPIGLTISLFNQLGQNIYRQRLNRSIVLNHEINLVGLSEGIYTIHVQSEDGKVKSEKIVKVN